MGVLHDHRVVGPLSCISFEQLATFHQIASVAWVIDQTGGEELALILEGGRVANNVPQVLVNLNRTTGSTTASVEPTVTSVPLAP